jgi:hypothetical protein
MTNIYTLLGQTEVWEPKDRPPVLVETMTPTHVRNLLRWFEGRAPALKERLAWSYAAGPQPSGDVACDMFQAELDQLERTAPETWLESRPLIKKLRELNRAYRETERKISATKNDRIPRGATARIDRTRGNDR